MREQNGGSVGVCFRGFPLLAVDLRFFLNEGGPREIVGHKLGTFFESHVSSIELYIGIYWNCGLTLLLKSFITGISVGQMC